MKVYVAVGSNLGDRASLVKKAEDRLRAVPGVYFNKKSPLYETEPAGVPAGDQTKQGKYLNGVWEIESSLEAKALLNELLGIETSLGRVRESSKKNESRPIDLDILFYGDKIIKSDGLSVPHPRLHERWFVLKPLADLCPDLVHPKNKKTVRELLSKVSA